MAHTFFRLAPAWSALLWTQIGQRHPLEVVPGVEATMAFDVFESVAEQPELYFTERLTRKMLALRQNADPCLVYAALDRFLDDAPPAAGNAEQPEQRKRAPDRKQALARMLPRVHRALVEAARRGHPAGILTRILDRLADVPATSPEADPRRIATWLAADGGRARPPSKLVLSRKRQPDWACPRVALADASGQDLSDWDDVAGKLESREAPIDVRIGAPLVAEVGEGTPLRPETLEMLYQVQHELWVAFGVLMPNVRVTATAWPGPWYRVAIPGWDSLITATPAPTLEALARALRDAVARSRLATITVDMTVDLPFFAEANRLHLYRWIEPRFSRNDIKLLLRGTLAPEEGAVAAPGAERTIRYLPWLLSSLPFWEPVCAGPARDDCLVQGLRETQKARLAGERVPEVPVATAGGADARIAAGIGALANDDPNAAVEAFAVAIREDPDHARRAFLDAYSRIVADLVKVHAQVRCAVPSPGQREWGGNARARREPIGDAIELQDDPAQRAHLHLCDLMYQIPTRDEANDARTIRRFLAAHSDGRTHWTREERYWLAYRMMEANARMRAPAQPASVDRETAKSLLVDVLGVDGLAAASKESGFKSLLDLCEENSSDRCYWDLLETIEKAIADNATLSSSSLLQFAGKLLPLPTSETQARLRRIGTLIDHAEARSVDVVDPTWREALADLSRLYRLQVGTKLLSHDDRGLEKLLDDIKAFRQAVAGKQVLARDGERLEREVLLHQGKVAEIRTSVEAQRRRWPELDLRELELDLALEEGRFDDMGELADDLLAESLWKDERLLFTSAIARLMVQGEPGKGGGDFRSSAERLLLSGGHQYCDYVRFLLYWRLIQHHQIAKARGLLEQRRLEIPDPKHDDPDARLADGDLNPWRDRLVRYYLDPTDANRRDIFEPLKDRATFETTALARAAESYSFFRCEALFYDALLQSITGDAATRRQRYMDQLHNVVQEACFETYEYHMAHWLLRQPAAP